MQVIKLHLGGVCFKTNKEIFLVVDKITSYADNEIVSGLAQYHVEESAAEISELIKHATFMSHLRRKKDE